MGMGAAPLWVIQLLSLGLIGALLSIRVRYAVDVPWWLIGTLVTIMSGTEILPKRKPPKKEHNDNWKRDS